MHMTKAAASLAAGAVLALILGASTAQAGTPPTVIASPNPSAAGATVTLNLTISSGACTGDQVEFRDVTGGGNALLCGTSVGAGAPGVATCPTNVLTTPGARTIQGKSTGVCTWAVATAPHTVNTAPTAVPTVGEWTMWGLAGLLLIGGGVFASRRFRATAA